MFYTTLVLPACLGCGPRLPSVRVGHTSRSVTRESAKDPSSSRFTEVAGVDAIVGVHYTPGTAIYRNRCLRCDTKGFVSAMGRDHGRNRRQPWDGPRTLESTRLVRFAATRSRSLRVPVLARVRTRKALGHFRSQSLSSATQPCSVRGRTWCGPRALHGA